MTDNKFLIDYRFCLSHAMSIINQIKILHDIWTIIPFRVIGYQIDKLLLSNP